jgi:hypothetical protein
MLKFTAPHTHTARATSPIQKKRRFLTERARGTTQRRRRHRSAATRASQRLRARRSALSGGTHGASVQRAGRAGSATSHAPRRLAPPHFLAPPHRERALRRCERRRRELTVCAPAAAARGRRKRDAAAQVVAVHCWPHPLPVAGRAFSCDRHFCNHPLGRMLPDAPHVLPPVQGTGRHPKHARSFLPAPCSVVAGAHALPAHRAAARGERRAAGRGACRRSNSAPFRSPLLTLTVFWVWQRPADAPPRAAVTHRGRLNGAASRLRRRTR